MNETCWLWHTYEIGLLYTHDPSGIMIMAVKFSLQITLSELEAIPSISIVVGG